MRETELTKLALSVADGISAKDATAAFVELISQQKSRPARDQGQVPAFDWGQVRPGVTDTGKRQAMLNLVLEEVK